MSEFGSVGDFEHWLKNKERLKEELKEAEDRGFKNGMLHAADMAEDAADGPAGYYYAEYQCLMELSDKLRKEVQGE